MLLLNKLNSITNQSEYYHLSCFYKLIRIIAIKHAKELITQRISEKRILFVFFYKEKD